MMDLKTFAEKLERLGASFVCIGAIGIVVGFSTPLALGLRSESAQVWFAALMGFSMMVFTVGLMLVGSQTDEPARRPGGSHGLD